MDDKNILELHVERQDTDGTAKRAAEYHKRLIHQTSIVSEKEYQEFLLERLEKDNGFVVRKATNFDRYFAVDREMLFKFLNDTQPDTMDYLRKIYKDDLEETIVSFINAETTKTRGSLIEVLKHGIELSNQKIELMYTKPATTFNPELTKKYSQNIFSVMEEVWASDKERIDVVIFLNGLAIMAFELKCNAAGQSYQDAIKELLKAVAEYSQLNREEFLETVKKAQTSQQSSEITRLKSRLAEAKKRVQELEKLICRIYEDNILGKLPDERYAILDGQYSKEQKDLSAEIADMEAELSGYEEGRRSAEKFIALVDKYQNFEELTTYMLNEFVEKIVVHERDRKGSVETTQEVEIYFNFIGRYLPPHFGEVKMTPEEIEEMEKREARKDRLHQNYLRRKANGKQQEYYERTKAKKKAELDAKKEEIRQEDIAKGVFIPLSLLPPAEPKKGVASA